MTIPAWKVLGAWLIAIFLVLFVAALSWLVVFGVLMWAGNGVLNSL